MNWVNIEISTLQGADFLGEDPVVRATWLCLLGHCCHQENSGWIPDCAGWADRKWQQVVGVTKREVSKASSLWKWHGNDLQVRFYPIEQEKQYHRKQEIGRKYGRGKQEIKQDDRSDDSTPSSSANEEPIASGIGNSKGKEGKEKGKERKQASRAGAHEGCEFPEAKPDWDMAQYAAAYKGMRPEFAHTPDEAIYSALKNDGDPAFRAAGFNAFAVSVAGMVNAPESGTGMLQRFIQKARHFHGSGGQRPDERKDYGV